MNFTKKKVLHQWKKSRRNIEFGYVQNDHILIQCYEQMKPLLFQAFSEDFIGSDRNEINLHGWLGTCAHDSFEQMHKKDGVYWLEIQDFLIRLDEIEELKKDQQGLLL